MRLHGKRHKSDCFYFRWHYGKQRRVCLYKEYVDKPTEKQVSAREAFTALRREVSRQLRDAVLREAWERRFAEDNEGYKFLHTYVYAKVKAEQGQAGTTETSGAAETTGSVGKEQNFRSAEVQRCRSAEVQKFRGVEVQKFRGVEGQKFRGVEVQRGRNAEVQRGRKSELPVILVYNGTVLPIFLPSEVPREERFCVLGEKEVSLQALRRTAGS